MFKFLRYAEKLGLDSYELMSMRLEDVIFKIQETENMWKGLKNG